MAEKLVVSYDKQFVIIKINEEYFAIDISYISSIIRMQPITRVPKAQPYFKGIINLRGQVIPVMSLKNRLGLEETEYNGSTRIVIIEEDNSLVGMIVDSAIEIISLDESKINKLLVDDNDDKSLMFVYGYGEYHKKPISLLDVSSRRDLWEK